MHSVRLLQGVEYKRIVVRTKKDDVLEGEEDFTLSLVSATNNGDISPTGGDATVRIMADRGAGGVIAISPEVSRRLLEVFTI